MLYNYFLSDCPTSDYNGIKYIINHSWTWNLNFLYLLYFFRSFPMLGETYSRVISHRNLIGEFKFIYTNK